MDLTSAGKKILEAVFRRYDKDNSGYLSVEEFISLLRRLSKHVSTLKGAEKAIANAVFALLDRNSDGKLDFDEFCLWWCRDSIDRYQYFVGEKSKLLQQAYNLYVTYTENGNMNEIDFFRMLDTLKISYSEEDFFALDKNSDGKIDFHEFCDWLDWF